MNHSPSKAPVCKNAVFNIPGQECITVLDLAGKIGRIAGNSGKFRHLPDRPVNDAAYRICGKRIAALGYSQSASIDGELANIHSQECEYRQDTVRKRRISIPARKIPPSAPALETLARGRVSIEFHKPFIADRERRFVGEALASGRSRFGGAFSTLATRKLRDYLKADRVELTSSCTAAMEVAAIASGIGIGDEVIVPSFTFAATATAFASTGAKIVLCDVDPRTMTVSLDHIQAVATPLTKVVVPVHYGGNVADMDAICRWARENSVLVVEDAAQALGATLRGRAAGTMGDFGAVSFHETKVAHCGHGGALIVNGCSGKMREAAMMALDRGTNFQEFTTGEAEHYEWTMQGSSYRPTELQCAQLAAQLEHLDEIVAKRQALWQRYKRGLGPALADVDEGVTRNGSAAIVFAETMAERDRFFEAAERAGFELSAHYKPLHLSRGYATHSDAVPSLVNCDARWRLLCRLPLHTSMTFNDADFVAQTLLAAKAQTADA